MKVCRTWFFENPCKGTNKQPKCKGKHEVFLQKRHHFVSRFVRKKFTNRWFRLHAKCCKDFFLTDVFRQENGGKGDAEQVFSRRPTGLSAQIYRFPTENLQASTPKNTHISRIKHGSDKHATRQSTGRQADAKSPKTAFFSSTARFGSKNRTGIGSEMRIFLTFPLFPRIAKPLPYRPKAQEFQVF